MTEETPPTYTQQEIEQQEEQEALDLLENNTYYVEINMIELNFNYDDNECFYKPYKKSRIFRVVPDDTKIVSYPKDEIICKDRRMYEILYRSLKAVIKYKDVKLFKNKIKYLPITYGDRVGFSNYSNIYTIIDIDIAKYSNNE